MDLFVSFLRVGGGGENLKKRIEGKQTESRAEWLERKKQPVFHLTCVLNLLCVWILF